MARVTVEDCLEKVENRFHLVHLASKRARQLSMTATDPFVEWENDKSTVVALREIAEGFVSDAMFERDEKQALEDARKEKLSATFQDDDFDVISNFALHRLAAEQSQVVESAEDIDAVKDIDVMEDIESSEDSEKNSEDE